MAGVLIPGSSPGTEPGRKLRKRIAANRSPFVFVTNRSVPYTNNVSERGLRPSVIFRKVTNGFRCEWDAETSAAFPLRRQHRKRKIAPPSLPSSNSCWPQSYPCRPSPRRGEQLVRRETGKE
jgi:Transposase IS66 family